MAHLLRLCLCALAVCGASAVQTLRLVRLSDPCCACKLAQSAQTRRLGGLLQIAAQGAARAAENPAIGYDKRLTAVVSPSGKLVRSYMAESALLQATGACHAGRPATVCSYCWSTCLTAAAAASSFAVVEVR